MKRLVFLLLVACGDKREAPAPTTSLPTTPAATTPLSEATQLLGVGKRDATAWVALAHAQVTAKRPEARSTLEQALAAARADTTRQGAEALVFAVEVLDALGDGEGAAKLLDEATERIAKDTDRPASLRLLLSPASNLGQRTRERLVLLANEDKLPVVVIVERAQEARRGGKPDLAIVEEAAKVATDSDEKILVALEAAFSGAPALAKKLVEGVPKLAHSQEAAQRAETFALLAAIHALANDKAASLAFEKKSLQAADKDSEEIENDDIWVFLGLGRAKRGDVDGAIELVKERIKDKYAASHLAHDLAEAGELDAAKKILGAIDGEARFRATADLVELLAITNLGAAQELVVAGPMWKMKLPGIEHVLRTYALRGDLAAVRALGEQSPPQVGPFVDLAARTLARQGKCTDAIAAAKAVTANRGECLAVIARHCPDSKL